MSNFDFFCYKWMKLERKISSTIEKYGLKRIFFIILFHFFSPKKIQRFMFFILYMLYIHKYRYKKFISVIVFVQKYFYWFFFPSLVLSTTLKKGKFSFVKKKNRKLFSTKNMEKWKIYRETEFFDEKTKKFFFDKEKNRLNKRI